MPAAPELVGERRQPARIVFAADRLGDGNFEVYSSLADGGDLVRLTGSTAADVDPTYSPDRSLIAFSRTVKRGIRSEDLGDLIQPNRESHLWVMSAEGLNPRRLYPPQENEGGDAQSADPPRSAEDQEGDHLFAAYPRFAPNGKEIAFYRVSRKDDGTFRRFITLVDVETKVARDIVRDGGGPLAWSPDGSRIAFSQEKDGKYRIYLVSRSGTGLTAVTDPPEEFTGTVFDPDKRVASDASPAFTPPGYPGEPGIVFARRRYVRNPETGDVEYAGGVFFVPLSDPREANVRRFDLGPQEGAGAVALVNGVAPAFSPDGGTLLFVRFGGETPQRYFTAPSAGGPVRELRFQPASFVGTDTRFGAPSWYVPSGAGAGAAAL